MTAAGHRRQVVMVLKHRRLAADAWIRFSNALLTNYSKKVADIGGVVVKPGETLKCDPGELYCVISQIALQAGKGNENVEVFVKVDGNILLMATLSVIRHPQYVTELIFEKQFELLHTSKTSNVSFMGYKFSDDDKSKEDKIGSEKLAASRRAIVQSFKPKVTFVKTKCPGKLNVAGCSDDDEIAKGKNSPEETPLNTPLEKKAKMRRAFTAKTTGVVVRPGEIVKGDPGEIYYHISQIALQAGKGNEDVRVFVKVAGQEILLGTLSVDIYPQHTTDLFLDCLLWLLSTSNASTEGDHDSDDEVPLAIPLYSNADDAKGKETKSGEGKAAGQGSSATLSSKPKATLGKTKNPGKLKANVGGNDKYDSEEGESDDDEKAKVKNRPAETPLKTPSVKKAKIGASSADHKSGSGTAKRSDHAHVATPYPSKVKKGTFNR
ncbi:hypothetical protein PR202_ga08560 [Eleusine coracana subsp. coracana]|uniref:Nucleoplasmin-like domain-containing protein n=1 Tax=Eleusine coracana subsp. coracana TaxID=191504 RepID=A0AAV5C0I2_ELECO|nr:hypothetical protein PR202_ga08560 [Eleusine coracana subsp. coracana]